jgi:hypothetical protein
MKLAISSIRTAASFAATLALAGVLPVAAQISTDDTKSADGPVDAAPISAAAAATGSGTVNHLSRWTNAQTLGNSVIIQNGANNIGIGDPNPASKLTVSGADANAASIRGTNTSNGRGVAGNSAGGIGVIGTHTNTTGQAAGVWGSTASTAGYATAITGVVLSSSAADSSIGVNGYNYGAGAGVFGYGANLGVHGVSISETGSAVLGEGDKGNGVAGVSDSHYGVYGLSNTGDGVYGTSAEVGVRGISTAADGSGVIGQNGAGNGVAGVSQSHYGVYGSSERSTGVYGINSGIPLDGDQPIAGVYGSSTYSTGVYGYSKNSVGVWGQSDGGPAGYFVGDVYVTGDLHVDGTVSKGAGSFKIDDPVDPAKKYLSHSFVESPDMMNIYNGNITTDADGSAIVTMPGYFSALNRDFRYQLTVVGQFAQAIVADEIHDNEFRIRTDKPGVKVSWQVTGVRHDAYADAHRIEVETDKPAEEIGYYLHPELFGQPESKSVANRARPSGSQPEPRAIAAK